MTKSTTIIITVDYPEGCRNKRVKLSRRTRYYPRDLSFPEVMIIEGDDGTPFYDIFQVIPEPLWRWAQ
jgi:hypothetical protein